jgi:hypothetical protein
MAGGTTFHFVTEGIHAALQRAAQAANSRDIRLGGGVETVRQYLRAGLVDEILPATWLRRASLAGIDALNLRYECAEYVPTSNATHIVLTKRR